MQVLQIKSSLNSTRAADLLFMAREMINAVCWGLHIIPRFTVFHLWDRQKAVYLQKKVEDFNGNARLFLHIFYRHCRRQAVAAVTDVKLHFIDKKSFFFCEERNESLREFGYVCPLRAVRKCATASLSRARTLSLSSCVFMFNSLMSWQNSSPLDIKGSMWSNARLESSDI